MSRYVVTNMTTAQLMKIKPLGKQGKCRNRQCYRRELSMTHTHNMLGDEDIERAINSIMLIAGSFMNNGFHGTVVMPGRSGRRINDKFRFCIDYEEEDYWDLLKIMDDAKELIGKNPEKYFQINAALCGMNNCKETGLVIRF